MKGNRSEAIAASKNVPEHARRAPAEMMLWCRTERVGPEGGTHAKGNASAC